MNDGWDGILDPGEAILWQGRPDGAFTVGWGAGVPVLFGLVFAGFALFWMVMAAQTGGFFWMFGLIHFAVGLSIALGPLLWPTWRRRHTWYTLTSKRAFIATDIPFRGKRLDSYPITADTVLSFLDDTPATIHFAETLTQTQKGVTRRKIGFERIADGRKVLGLMRQAQDTGRQNATAPERDIP